MVLIGFGVQTSMHMERQPIRQPCSIPANGKLRHSLTKKTVLSGRVSLQSRGLSQTPHLKVSSKSL